MCVVLAGPTTIRHNAVLWVLFSSHTMAPRLARYAMEILIQWENYAALDLHMLI